MTAVHLISGALDDGARRELVYDGDLLVFKDVGPMKELCTLTDAIVREVSTRQTRLGPSSTWTRTIMTPALRSSGDGIGSTKA
jgi:hypothetical protein